jgi:hypothetical protein
VWGDNGGCGRPPARVRGRAHACDSAAQGVPGICTWLMYAPGPRITRGDRAGSSWSIGPGERASPYDLDTICTRSPSECSLVEWTPVCQ